MNYAGPVLGFVIILAIVDWGFFGRVRFQVPANPVSLEVEEQSETSS
jgi:hypothetical protein